MSKQIKRRWAVALCLVAALVMALCLVGCGRVVDTDEYPGEPPAKEKQPFWAEYTPEQWSALLQEKVIPYVVATLTALSALYLAVSPILVKVRTASEAFDKSSNELKATNESALEDAKRSKARYIKMQKAVEEAAAAMTAEVHAAMAQLQEVKEQIAQQNAEIRADMQRVYDMESDILLMGKLGFGEDTELVKKGIASQIARIGEGGEHDDPQT